MRRAFREPSGRLGDRLGRLLRRTGSQTLTAWISGQKWQGEHRHPIMPGPAASMSQSLPWAGSTRLKAERADAAAESLA